jgi:hypothetical protein
MLAFGGTPSVMCTSTTANAIPQMLAFPNSILHTDRWLVGIRLTQLEDKRVAAAIHQPERLYGVIDACAKLERKS